MGKNKNLKENTSQNFILRGLNSIQVGLYVLLGAYLLKFFLTGFVSGELPIGMMSIEIIEVLGLSVVILVFLFSTLAIFFSGRRHARRSGYKVWNSISKKHFWTYFLLILLGVVVLKTINSFGLISYLAPTFFAYLSLILLVLNKQRKQPYYLISGINFLLAILVFLIPSYWYSALLITGVTFLVYGIIVRK